MSHRTAIIREMEAYGLSKDTIEVLDVPEPVNLDGLFAFRQGLAEAGNGGKNPVFPIALRDTREYHLGTSVVDLCQQVRGVA